MMVKKFQTLTNRMKKMQYLTHLTRNKELTKIKNTLKEISS